MTTKTKYLVIALLLLVLVTTSVGLSTWNIHYQAVIGTIKHHDTSSMEHSFLDEYIYFGSTTNGNATANKGLCNYPIGFEVDDEGNLVLGTDSYQVNQEDVFTFTYQSGLGYTPTVFVPSATASKGDDDHPTALFLKDGKIDTNWGIEDVFGEISFEYQYRKVAMPFVADYKGNSDNYCEINAVNYQENRISVYLTWKNGKGNHQGTNVLVDLVVNDDGTHTTTIEGVTEQIANKISVGYSSGIVTIGVNGFSSYELNMTNQGWSTDVPDSVGVYQCRISAKLVDSESDNSIANKNASELTDSEKVALEALELINEKTENDVKYATQVTYAVLPAEVTQQNKNTSYTNGTKTLQANRIGTTRGTMPLAEENQQTQEAADEYVFTLGTGDAAISGTSFVYKGQDYNIKIEAYFQPTEGADVISINYAEDQENDAKDIVRHEDITSDNHVYSTYGFSSDPNYIVINPAVYYTIIKQEVKLTGWGDLETTYNGDAQVVTPKLENHHGEVKAKIEYSYNGDAHTTHTNAGIYTVTASLVDAEENSGHSSNFFLVNYASNGNSTEKTDLTATFTINKAPLIVTAKNHEITYGDAFAHDGVTHSGWVIGTDNATSSLAGTLSIVSTDKDDKIGYNQESADTRKVGDYTLIASGYEDVDDESGKPIYADDGKHNYTFTYVDGILTVKQLVAKFDWSNLDPTYNGAAQKPVATVTNEQYDDDVSIFVIGEKTNANVKVENGNIVTNTDGSFVLTDEYTATAYELTGAQAGNYKLPTDVTQAYVILPKVAELAWDQVEFVYNTNSQAPKATVSNLENGDTCDVTVEVVGEHVIVGSYTATATNLSNSNYTLPTNPSVGYTIVKASVNKPAEDGTPYVYSGEPHTYKLDENSLYTIAGTLTQTNAGSYDITISLVDTHNYKWTNSDSKPLTYTFTIAKVTTVISNLKLDGWTFGQEANSPSASINHSTAIEYTYYNSDGTKLDSAPTNAGTYTVVASVAGTNNYTAATTEPVAFTIDKADYDMSGIKFTGANITYDGNPHSIAISGELPTNVSVSYEGNGKTTVADSGTVTAIFSTTDSNYNAPDSMRATLTIKQATTSITGLTIANWTYGETAKSPTATTNFGTIKYWYKLTSADDSTYTETVPTNAGNYTVKAEVVGNNNYTSDTKTATFIISPKPVNKPVITDNTKVFTYNGTNQQEAILANITYDKTAMTAEGTASIYTDAGNKEITFTLVNNNYCWADETTAPTAKVSITINKATPTVKINLSNTTPIHGEIITISATITGVTGETISGTLSLDPTTITASFTGTSPSVSREVTVTYSFTPVLTNHNYESTSATKTLQYTVNAVAYIDSTYYGTVEAALEAAVSGKTVYVIPGTNPTIKTDATIKSGVTLCLPYEGTLWGSQTSEVQGGSAKYATQHAFGNATLLKSHVKLAENTTLTNNGTLQIGGVLTGGNGGSNCGFTFGNHAQLTLGTNSKLLSEDGSIVCYGFITEETSNNGSLVKIGNEAGNGTGSIKMPWVMYEHRGGTNTVNLSELSDQAIKDIISTALGGRTSYITGNFKTIPFNRFFLPNVSTTMTVHYGGSVIGLVNMYADEQINQAEIKVIGSTTDCMIQLSANNSKLVAKHNVDTSVTKLDIYGDMAVNPMSMKLYMKTTKAGIDVKAEVTVNTATIFLPISWLYDISLHTVTGQSSATAKFNQDIKILPGGKLTVDRGVNVTANKLIIYDHSWTEDSTLAASVYETTYGTKGRLILNGKLTVNELSGFVETTLNTGELLINTSNTLTAVEAVSKGATRSITYLVVTIDNFSSVNYTTINRGITAYGYIIQNDGSTSQSTSELKANTTYKSNGLRWYQYGDADITYYLNGGTLATGTDTTLTMGSPLTEYNLIAPTKDYHTFDGWYRDVNFTTAADTTTPLYGNINLYAKWTPILYTITFDTNGGTSIKSITNSYGTKITIPENPTRTGYTFTGWDKEIPSTMPAENITITAQWQINQYTITFEDGDTTIATITQDYGTAISAPADPTKTGHTFEGWSQSIPATMPAENLTIDATWTINTYNVTIVNEENVVLKVVENMPYGSAYGDILPELTKEGYLLTWQIVENSAFVTPDSILTLDQDHTIRAVWEEQGTIVEIQFDSQGGSTVKSQNLNAGSKFTSLPTTTRTGYTFVGWFTQPTDGTQIVAGSDETKVPEEATTYYAHWDPNNYTVTFNATGGLTTTTSKTVTYASTYGDLPPPTRTGYTFIGWFTASTGGNKIESTTTVEITANQTLYAQWSINYYTITFSAGSGTFPSGTQTEYEFAYGANVDITYPTGLTKEGYTIDGWDISIPETMPAENIQIEAQWKANQYTITFNPNGGECSKASETGSIEQSITLPTPTRTNYTFNGWYTAATGGEKVGVAGATYVPTADITLYAQWTRIIYTVTYNANSGSVSPTSIPVNAGESTTLPTPTRSNYTFNGWYTASSGGTKVGDAGASYTPTGNITLYAQWSYSGCLAAGTLITMADGTTKKIEELKVGDIVITFNHNTGKLSQQRVLRQYHINQETISTNVINLVFNDSSIVRIVESHGFFNMTLNKYVFISENNYQEFIGHQFYKLDEQTLTGKCTMLERVYITYETIRIFSPVTEQDTNLFANMFLTMPSMPMLSTDLEGLVNMFEFDPVTLAYDQEKMIADIEKYGLYTYEEFAQYMDEDEFNASPIPYLKVSVGKGLMTYDDVILLIEHNAFRDDMESIYSDQTTTTDVAEATLPPQVVTGDEQQQDTVEKSIE